MHWYCKPEELFPQKQVMMVENLIVGSLNRVKCTGTVIFTRHKGLKAFIENDDGKGVRPDQVKRVKNIITALMAALNIDEVSGPPGWRLHQLVGDRAGTWSISVSGNWRITFDIENGDVTNLDLEDYH